MKKILISIVLAIYLLLPTAALAQTTGKQPKVPCAQSTDPKDIAICKEINKIFEIKDFKGNENIKNISEQVTSNKEASFSDVFAGIINIMTGIAVVMTFVGIVVAGGIFVFSEGEEGRVTKARTIMLYVAIGDLIIAASYAIVKGITLIKPLP